MRKLLILLLALALLAMPVLASETGPVVDMDPVIDGIPESAASYMPDVNSGFLNGFLELVRKALEAVIPGMREAIVSCVAVIAAAVLCALFKSADPSGKSPAADIIGAIAIASLMLQPVDALIQQGIATVQELSDYGKLLLPVMSTAMVASGGTTTASALYLGTAFFDSILTMMIARLLTPMIYLFLAVSMAASAMDSDLLNRLRDLIKSVATWGLKLVLYVFTGYMTITRVISGSADAAAVKAAKLALSGVVPVVGSIISDASETVVLSATAVRGTAGVFGMLAILATGAVPFLTIGIQYLLLKLTAALCGVVGNKNHAALTENFAQAMGLLLAMTGTCCLLLLISTVCFMKGVI